MHNLIWSNLWFTISCYSQNRGQWWKKHIPFWESLESIHKRKEQKTYLKPPAKVLYMVVLVDYQYWQSLGGSLAFKHFRLRYGMMQQKHWETIEMLDLQLIGGRDMPINCKDRLDVGTNIVTLVDIDNKTIQDLWYDAPEKKPCFQTVLIEVENVL